MDSVIVPVIKNKNKRINDKGNYRPICLSTVCSKMVEMALARRLSDSLNSSHNQFGFKLEVMELSYVYLLTKNYCAFMLNAVQRRILLF